MADAIQTSNPSIESIRERIAQYKTEHDPEVMLKQASQDTHPIQDEFTDLTTFKLMTLNEFGNGILMCENIKDEYKTFAIEMLRQLQLEYDCKTISEKSIAERATLNFIRSLEIEKQLRDTTTIISILSHKHTCGKRDSLFPIKECVACHKSQIELQCYTILSKDLDKTDRRYCAYIHTLRMMKQTPIQITVKAQTAVIGQNQVVQSHNSHE